MRFLYNYVAPTGLSVLLEASFIYEEDAFWWLGWGLFALWLVGLWFLTTLQDRAHTAKLIEDVERMRSGDTYHDFRAMLDRARADNERAHPECEKD